MNARCQYMTRLPGVVAHLLGCDRVRWQGADHSWRQMAARRGATVFQPAHIARQPDGVERTVLKVDEQQVRPCLCVRQASFISQASWMGGVDRLTRSK